MGTTATLPDTNASVSADVRNETATYALQHIQTPDGTDAAGEPKFKSELKVLTNAKDIEEAKAKDPQSIIIEQTFGYQKAVTPAGIAVAITDEDERVNIFNAGLKSRFMAKCIQKLKATDEEGNPEFQPVEGVFDMQETLNEPLQRRNLSPMDKLAKAVSSVVPGITQEQIAAFMAQIQAQKAQS